MHHQGDLALGAAFKVLRQAGVQCRAYADETGIEILWRPKPSQMTPGLLSLVIEHAQAMACILTPEPDAWWAIRPFWSSGPIAACIGCGRSTVQLDPLGQPRHSRCGWLGQPINLSPAASQQKRVWHGGGKHKKGAA